MSKISGWEEVSLGEVCEFKYGKSLPAKDRTPGPYGVYGSNGQVDTHTSSLSDGPTVVIGRKGSFGEVAYSKTSCWPIDTTYFVNSSSTKVDLKWLFYRLRSLGLTELNRAAAVPGLGRKDAYRKRFLLPSLGEQRQIAEVLDQADALRAKRRAAVALLDDLVQSLFLDMFGNPATNAKGWPVRTIGDLVDSATYGTSQKAASKGDLPVLRMGNITTRGRIDLSNLKYMQCADVRDRHLARPGDLLFNRTNSADLVGKTAVYRSGPPIAYAGYLIRLRTNSKNHPEYMSAFLNSRYGKVVLRNMCKSIIGMANINARELQGIRIPEPPRDLQQEFARRVEKIEHMRQAQLGHMSELDDLFGSLQQRAFRGELWED